MEVLRENDNGQLLVKKGKVWRIFNYGTTIWLEKDVRKSLELLLARKGYAKGDHEARGIFLSAALLWALPKIMDGELALQVSRPPNESGARFVDFAIDQTDYKALAEVYRAFPMLRRKFTMNELIKIALEEIGEEIDERTS